MRIHIFSHILLFAVVVSILAGIASAGYEERLYAYWTMDNAQTGGGESQNYTGQLNLGVNGVDTGQTGILGHAYDYELGDAGDYLNRSYSSRISSGNDWTLSLWFNMENYTGSTNYVMFSNSDGSNSRLNVFMSSGKPRVAIYDGAFYYCNTSASQLSVGSWHNIIVAHTASGNICRAWIDGTQAWTASTSQTNAGTSSFTIGAHNDNGLKAWFDGLIDEVAVWDYAFDATGDNASAIYNGGSGFNPLVPLDITLTIHSPANNTNTTTNQFYVNFTADSTDSSDGDCYLYANGSLINSTPFTDGVVGDMTATLADGEHTWELICNTSTISDTQAGSFNYYIDSSAPVCNFGTSYRVVNLNDGFDFDVTCTDNHFYSLNVSCTTYSFFIDGLDVTSYSFNQTFTTNGSFAGDSCTYEYCDGHTASELKSHWTALTSESRVEVLKDAEKVFDLSVDTIGAVVTYDLLMDRMSYTFDVGMSFKDKHKFTLNMSPDSVYIPSEEFAGWMVSSREKIWVDFNGEGIKDVKVKKIKSGVWEIEVKTDKDKIKFESTGELNCVSGTFSVESAWADMGSFTPFECPIDSTAGSIGFVGVMFLFMFMIVINVTMLRYPIIDGFLAVVLMILGVSLWSCNQWYTYFVVVFSLGYLGATINKLFRHV